MNPNAQKFIQLTKHPVKFRLFLFYKLPSAYFSGLKVIEFNEEKAVVTVPYKWFTKNPFNSTYFACLAMAAEMSTGLLAMMYIYKRKPATSMLITKMEANYFKKAVGNITFLCQEGKQIQETIEESILTGEPKTVSIKSTGKNKNGEIIAEFLFTWSFKVKPV
ncbi:MAG: DUF4442 domain-containing protein [Chitinophagaceae bacterium]|nr:DUF4442 domain-containing protein [Chitinophagaceae bacterium]